MQASIDAEGILQPIRVYATGKGDGRQYIAVFATGSAFGPPGRGADGLPANNEALMTWALPE